MKINAQYKIMILPYASYISNLNKSISGVFDDTSSVLKVHIQCSTL